MTKQQAGKLGGLKTRQNHTIDYFKRIGAMGGKPRRKTLSELQAEQIKDVDTMVAGDGGHIIMPNDLIVHNNTSCDLGLKRCK